MIDRDKFKGHTPGPWNVLGDDEYAHGCPMIEVDNGKGGSEDWASIAYVVADVDDGLLDKDRANAALIAAAPDLLAENERLRAVADSLENAYLAHTDGFARQVLRPHVFEARAALATKDTQP